MTDAAHTTQPTAHQWVPGGLFGAPAYEPLRRFGPDLEAPGWPDLESLQRLCDTARVTTAGGARLRLVGQARRPGNWEDRYEARIYLRGELQVRTRNWHDLFNVLAWAAFPRAKAALNARHYRALLEQRAAGALNRGPVQDALTLFDEGGVVVASSDSELLSMLGNFAWKDLFWRNRDRVRQNMHVLVVGHALYEKLLDPYAGITGRGMLIETDADIHALPIDARIARLDALLEQRLGDARCLAATRDLAPLPLLGIPGWCSDNDRESYYDDIRHFRPGRSAQSPL